MRLSVQIEFDKTLDLVTAKNNVIVGRSPKSDLVIPHDSISRNHCRIEVEKGIFYITDLGSSNGTFLDGQKVTPEQRTPFLTSSQLTLGKLDCEVSEYTVPQETPGKVEVQDVSPKGDYTATMRVSRLDLNKAPRPPEAAKPKPKGPRNPVSEASKKRVQKKDSKKGYIILFMVVAAVVAYLINEGLK